MAVAFLSAQRSKDPSKQVGACIVGRNKVILGIGYNGFPRGCGDHALPWAKKSAQGFLGTKYPYVVRPRSVSARIRPQIRAAAPDQISAGQVATGCVTRTGACGGECAPQHQQL